MPLRRSNNIADLHRRLARVRDVFFGIKILRRSKIAKAAFLFRSEIIAEIIPRKIQIARTVIDYDLLEESTVGGFLVCERRKRNKFACADRVIVPILYDECIFDNAETKVCFAVFAYLAEYLVRQLQLRRQE